MQINQYNFEIFYKSNVESKGNRNLISKYAKQSKKSNSAIDRDYWKLLLEMLNFASLFPVSEKNEFAELVAEDYEKDTGYKMGGQMLTALADFILDEVLSDRGVDKVTNNEYPVLGFRQLIRRGKRELALEKETVDLCEIKNRRDYVKKKNTMEYSDTK